MGQIEWETMAWVGWYNSERLLSAISYIPPQEAEEAFYETLNEDQKAV
jgi:putative transposase